MVLHKAQSQAEPAKLFQMGDDLSTSQEADLLPGPSLLCEPHRSLFAGLLHRPQGQQGSNCQEQNSDWFRQLLFIPRLV